MPGRFRVLSDPEVAQDQKLSDVRSLIIDGPMQANISATEFEPNERAAIIGRLIPTTLAPPPPSWRLTVPRQLVRDAKDGQFVLMFSLGYVEIWFRDIYLSALAPPLDSVL